MNGSDLRRQMQIRLERLARAGDELHIIQFRLTENPDAVVEKTAARTLTGSQAFRRLDVSAAPVINGRGVWSRFRTTSSMPSR